MKSVKQKLQETKPDRVAAFEKGASEFAKKIVGNFKDYEFVRLFLKHSIVLQIISAHRCRLPLLCPFDSTLASP